MAVRDVLADLLVPPRPIAQTIASASSLDLGFLLGRSGAEKGASQRYDAIRALLRERVVREVEEAVGAAAVSGRVRAKEGGEAVLGKVPATDIVVVNGELVRVGSDTL
jgi:hypothetical protein